MILNANSGAFAKHRMLLTWVANGIVNRATRAMLRSLCVFCGSRDGDDSAHRAAAERLGVVMAERGIRLVYGGGRVGMMGVIADLVVAHGGQVTGVIPEFLVNLERGHPDIDELIVVDSMHERQRRMAELADGFVALPGGLGTLAETIEMVNWRKMSLHKKPVAVVNIGGYWDPLAAIVKGFVTSGFSHPKSAALFTIVDSVDDAIEALEGEQVRSP